MTVKELKDTLEYYTDSLEVVFSYLANDDNYGHTVYESIDCIEHKTINGKITVVLE
jgi:hypothetical protein